MYFVIKRQENTPLNTFIAFKVPKYIASKKNDTIIFEFTHNDKTVRKWVKKDEIILLTENKEYFSQIYKQLEATQEAQKLLVEEAQNNLNQTLQNFEETMQDELDKCSKLQSESDILQNL